MYYSNVITLFKYNSIELFCRMQFDIIYNSIKCHHIIITISLEQTPIEIIEVETGNKHFQIQNQIVISNDFKSLCYCPSTFNNVSIPENITTIIDFCFFIYQEIVLYEMVLSLFTYFYLLIFLRFFLLFYSR